MPPFRPIPRRRFITDEPTLFIQSTGAAYCPFAPNGSSWNRRASISSCRTPISSAILASLCIDTVVLDGITIHACVRMAAIDAYQRNLQVR